ncbi:MAG: AMP-binding protein [candidate division KSB1 bacterium]|nr:AMP-binding protein [candidate division KSB1 bacterium]
MSSLLDNLTLGALLKQSVAAFGNKTALAEIDGEEISYAELGQRVDAVAHLLHEEGVIAGDRVAILSENCPQWGIAYFALAALGAIAVPILPEFHPDEVRHILRHSGAKALFVSEKLYLKIEEAEIPSLLSVILIERFAPVPLRTKKDRLRELLLQGEKEFAKLKEAALKLAGKLHHEAAEDDVASIIYTSGTTGSSKGVMLTHKNIIYDATATMEIVPLGPEDRMLSMLPLSHAYECTLGLVAPIMAGAAVYYLDKPPTPRVLLPALQKVKPTILLTVPLVIEKIYKNRIAPQFKKNAAVRSLYKLPWMRKKLHRIAGKKLLATFGGSLRCYCIGGAALNPEVEAFLREAGFPYAIGYGLTETAPLIFGTGPENTVYRSCGKALRGVECRIDHPHPQTGEGEICVRGPMLMKGYYKDEARTAEAMRDGWFHTGDLGVLDANGYLFIKGRSKNMLLGPSGENIYPEEIESILNEDERVLESLVFQQEGKLAARVYLNYELLDQLYGAAKLEDKLPDVLEDIRRQTNAKLSSFSRLNKLIVQPEPFEKTPTMKIKRYLYVS